MNDFAPFGVFLYRTGRRLAKRLPIPNTMSDASSVAYRNDARFADPPSRPSVHDRPDTAPAHQRWDHRNAGQFSKRCNSAAASALITPPPATITGVRPGLTFLQLFRSAYGWQQVVDRQRFVHVRIKLDFRNLNANGKSTSTGPGRPERIR